MTLRLYSYFRSSASYRVRIALNLKEVDYEILPVHLLKSGGEQHFSDFHAKNAQELVPVLESDTVQICQSLAIIEYLEECYPKPALLPKTAEDKALVRSLALLIACEIHPLNNLRVLQYLKQELAVTEEEKAIWYRHWIQLGLTALEEKTRSLAGQFCFGDQVGLADIFLIPQLYNARKFECDLNAYPTLLRVETQALLLPAFEKAAPQNQMDFE